MKHVLILLSMVFLFSVTSAQTPFYRTTKHKTVNKLSKKQVKKIKSGKNMYKRVNNKVIKNF